MRSYLVFMTFVFVAGAFFFNEVQNIDWVYRCIIGAFFSFTVSIAMKPTANRG
ncbi:MAG: hypothetical protein ABFD50_08325 [Smithella sp.]